DVLRLTEMPFDPPAQPRQPHDLIVRQHLPVLPLDLLDDPAVAHLVAIGVDQAGDQGLAQAEAGLDRCHLPVPCDRIGREQASRSPSLARKRAISSCMSSGMAYPAMTSRIAAASSRIASRSSTFSSANRSSRPPIAGAAPRTRLKASVETQKPSGTRLPSSLE